MNDPRAYLLEINNLTTSPRPNSGTGPTRDPTGTSSTHKADFGRDGNILQGRVVDSVAYAHFYKVQVERGGATIMCCAGSHASFQLYGATSLGGYVPGTQVLIYRHTQMKFGIIICAIPDWMISSRDALSDMIVQGSNVGIRADTVHRAPFATKSNGGIIDFSSGRPLDGLMNGEWGATSEYGLSFFLDNFMAYMRVDEETGLFAFLDDSLIRLAGHNMQQWSAGWTREDMDDQNEWNSEEGWAPYLWEARGTFAANTTPVQQRTVDEVQRTSPQYSLNEPYFEDQVPFHRRTEFRGYLAQGGRSALSAPELVEDSLEYNRLSTVIAPNGLFEQVTAMDGQHGMRSATGLYIGKDPFIPVPKRIRAANSPSGDTPLNYRAAGTYGGGSGGLHYVTGDLAGDQGDAQRYLGLMDNYVYLFNWKSPHPFYYHKLDWYLPEESETAAGSSSPSQPLYTELSTTQFLAAPPPIAVKVDNRYGSVMVFPNRSMLAFTNDGGIVMIDGWGSEHRMRGGEIRESCAGDKVTMTGRSHVVLAGYDAVVRANNSVFVSANWGDIRVKAERNMVCLAGNGRCGGFLFEARSGNTAYRLDEYGPLVSGFNVRSGEAAVVLGGRQVLISTQLFAQGSTLPSEDEAPRHIVLDAGPAKIITTSKFFDRHIGKAAVDMFEGGSANEYWKDFAQINTNLAIYGRLHVFKTGTFGEDVAVNGWVAGRQSRLTPATIARIDQVVTAISSRTAEVRSYREDSAADAFDIRDLWPAIEQIQFKWPSTADLAIDSEWTFTETRWQQTARLSGQSLPKWQENPSIADDGEESYPYPGKDAWKLGTGFKQQDLTLYSDSAGGMAISRGGDYEAPEYGEIAEFEPDNNLTVVIDPNE